MFSVRKRATACLVYNINSLVIYLSESYQKFSVVRHVR